MFAPRRAVPICDILPSKSAARSADAKPQSGSKKLLSAGICGQGRFTCAGRIADQCGLEEGVGDVASFTADTIISIAFRGLLQSLPGVTRCLQRVKKLGENERCRH